MSFCRLCKEPYKDTETSRAARHNIYKRKSDENENLKTRIFNVTGIELEQGTNKAETICRACFRKIPVLEKAKNTLREWNAEPNTNNDNELHGFDDQINLKSLTFSCFEEARKLENDTLLTDTSKENILQFNDKIFCDKVEEKCPTLAACIKGSLGILVDDKEQTKPCRTSIYGSIFKTRYSKRGCIVASRNDQLLVAGGMKKRGFSWTNKLGVSNSYNTALKRNREMGDDYDREAKRWKASWEYEYSQMKLAGLDPANPDDVKTYRQEHGRPDDYSIVSDNLDFEQHARFQDIKNHNKSIHWLHSMAVKSRTTPKEEVIQEANFEQRDLLPDAHTFETIYETNKILVARILVTHFPAFKMFSKNVCGHIKHPYSEEMAKKSEIVPLGLLFKAENKTGEMVDILKELTNRYVPKTKLEDDTVEVIRSIVFGGDQLTEERASNAQRGFLDGSTKYEKLQGLQPTFEGWHTKRLLYKLKFKQFGKESSPK
eukprot:TCONS_00042697-protein